MKWRPGTRLAVNTGSVRLSAFLPSYFLRTYGSERPVNQLER